MASATEYTHTRWITMQVVLWGVLAATAALAALVDNKQAWFHSSGLGGSQTAGTMTYRLPEHWKVTEGSGATVAQATEPAGASSGPGRMILIARQSAGRNMLPLEFLDWSGLVDNTQSVSPMDFSDQTGGSALTICGWPANGYLLSPRRFNGLGGDSAVEGDPEPRTLVVCCVLPGGDAVAVEMGLFSPPTPEDGDLLAAVVASITIKGVLPPPVAGGIVNLPNGVSVSVGAQGTIYPPSDAKLTARDVRLMRPNGTEMLVEIVPFTLFGDQSPASAADALATHEMAWSGATAAIQATAPMRQWKFTPTSPESLPVLQQAYLAVDANGRGLIAIFHMFTMTQHGGGIDRAWTDLSKGIAFGPSADADYPAMLAAGAVQAHKLASAGASAIALPDGTWWQWSRPDASGAMSMVGWTQFDRGLPTFMQTRRILWTDQVARWTTQWKRAPNSTTIIGCTTAFDVADAPDASADHPPQFQTVATETATITNPGPTLWLTPVFSRQMHFNVFVPAPEQFVAGPTLPAALGRIAIDPDLSGPVVLRTDGPAGWERSPAVWNALSVFVQKVKSPATSQPSDAPRAVDVEVNGSGETSRWYFHPDGTFDHAEMAGGVVVQPGDANQIKSTFAGDPRMNVDN